MNQSNLESHRNRSINFNRAQFIPLFDQLKRAFATDVTVWIKCSTAGQQSKQAQAANVNSKENLYIVSIRALQN